MRRGNDVQLAPAKLPCHSHRGTLPADPLPPCLGPRLSWYRKGPLSSFSRFSAAWRSRSLQASATEPGRTGLRRRNAQQWYAFYPPSLHFYFWISLRNLELARKPSKFGVSRKVAGDMPAATAFSSASRARCVSPSC